MTIAERRAMVEILLCGATSGCLAAGAAVTSMDDGIRAAEIVSQREWRMSYHDAAMEYAYRLIEQSPTLVREFFGKEEV